MTDRSCRERKRANLFCLVIKMSQYCRIACRITGQPADARHRIIPAFAGILHITRGSQNPGLANQDRRIGKYECEKRENEANQKCPIGVS